VVNARDAMPDGGQITIETQNVTLDAVYADEHIQVEAGEYVLLAVSDTGQGMDAETMSHVFEPFFTTKEVGKGTGLGLSTVYGIVNQNYGHIQVYSEPGVGATFKIYFPRDAGVTTAPPAEPGNWVQHLPHGTETVLLVEDDAAVRAVTRGILEKSGYTVLEASNGEQALQIIERHTLPLHLLLTDIIMPQMSGRPLVEQVSVLRPDLKVLYMSGYTDDAVVRHGVLAAEMDFLQKPFTALKLAQKVREVLDR
jgi:two-component system, cell cycle sensor histidine kinase and response regulator CckA